MIDKIYVHLTDGAEAWVLITAQEITTYQYLILDDEEYADNDPSVLFEFYPGDLVGVKDSDEEEYAFRAVKLISLSLHPDRKYLYFKFKATFYQMATDRVTAEVYQDEIVRIQNEITAGQFMYRGIRETIRYIDMNMHRQGTI